MSIENMIVQQDVHEMMAESLDWELLRAKSVLITGAYSMLGTYLAYLLLSLNQEKNLETEVFLLGRNEDTLRSRFKEFSHDTHCHLLCQDVIDPILIDRADYIFHFAGNCSPYYICNEPVDILRTNLLGTFSVMELAKRCHSKRVIIASTREVYGDVTKQESVLAQLKSGVAATIVETTFGGFDSIDNRSCYPESKRAEESIARSYYLQYGVPFNSIRMAHIYGPGMKTEQDGRVMSDFIGDAIHGRDIVLHSDGSAERAFCYLSDAIIGILHVAFKGEPGEAYNLSNESESQPISEVAQKVCNASQHDIHVRFEDANTRAGYCQYPRVALDNHKIQRLGFTPKVKLADGISRTLSYFAINQHLRGSVDLAK